MSKSVFGYFKTKKVLLSTKPRGGGRGLKALVDCPLKKELFCGFPNLIIHIIYTGTNGIEYSYTMGTLRLPTGEINGRINFNQTILPGGLGSTSKNCIFIGLSAKVLTYRVDKISDKFANFPLHWQISRHAPARCPIS